MFQEDLDVQDNDMRNAKVEDMFECILLSDSAVQSEAGTCFQGSLAAGSYSLFYIASLKTSRIVTASLLISTGFMTNRLIPFCSASSSDI